MLQKGTALPVKKILGWLLLMVGIGLIAKISLITDIINSNPVILGVVLLITSYFLIISGRQL